MSVAIMTGILKGIEANQDRTMKIQAARDEKRQKDETIEVNRKIAEAKLEALKLKSGNDPMVALLEDQLNNEFDLQDAQSTVEDDQIENALSTEQEHGQVLQRTGAKVAASLMRQQQQAPKLDWSYNTGSKSYTIKPKASQKEDSNVSKLMGVISAKQDISDSGTVINLTKKQALLKSSKALGYGWENKHPEVLDLINRRYTSATERLKPDNFGYRMGEEKSVAGKGRFQYLGNDKWKKIETK